LALPVIVSPGGAVTDEVKVKTDKVIDKSMNKEKQK
jgi:hypothetical protein